MKTFWNALLLTIEFRTESRRVAGLESRTSFPCEEPSKSANSGVEVLGLEVANCQLKSKKSLRKVLKTDAYDRDPKVCGLSTNPGVWGVFRR